jgi:FkbM family methyltransferase
MKKLAFDIGANIGEFTKSILDKFEKIVCFDPIEECLLKLKSSDFYDKNKIILENIAISDRDEEQLFYICEDSIKTPCYAISSLNYDWTIKSRFVDMTHYNESLKLIEKSHVFNKTINVKCNTLETIIKKYGVPDFIKIDVEGHEFTILNNFNLLLENTVFCFEWTEEFKNELLNTIEHLDALGYKKFYCLYEDKFLETIPEWKDKNSFLDFNSFIPQRKQLWGMIYFRK